MDGLLRKGMPVDAAPYSYTTLYLACAQGNITAVRKAVEASLAAAIELESHTQLYVRLTTQNFQEATRARAEGRAPDFTD